MRLLMISGIMTVPEMDWMLLNKAFKRLLPGAEFCVETEPYCHVWEIDRFRAFTLKTAAKYDTGGDMIIVGHSLGGVIGCAVQSIMRETRVIGICTIHAPHQFLGGIFTRMLHAYDVSAPIVSFQALHDELVWWGSRHPQSVLHVKNHSNHFSDIVQFRENAERIARTAVRTFLK